jgi:putative endonuclease
LGIGDRLRDRVRQKRWPAGQANGRRGEDLAHRCLTRRGYMVVARNYRPPAGGVEIDLVAWHSGTLVFVEVKTRAGEEFGAPDRAVDREKQAFVERAALDYAARAGVAPERIRFDIVSVVLGRPPRVEVMRDAFRLGQTL